MSQVITFEDFTPSPRFDSIPWTEARIEEAVSSSGPWTQIDVIALVPVDSNPANPIARNLTTQLASDGNLWYRIIFADADGDFLQPTTPIFNAPSPAAGTTIAPWITGAQVADCCEVTPSASDSSVFDNAAEVATDLLYQLSGRKFPGILQATARPCRTGCGCPWQILSRGYVIWNPQGLLPMYWGYWACGDDTCGCSPVSKVRLAGHVISVSEVKIDNVAVDSSTYRVDKGEWLVRVTPDADDQQLVWPGCQNLSLPDDQPGTWSVTYTYGREAPASGVAAATELACEIYKGCSGQECALPMNTIRVARQGIVMEKPAFLSWGFEKGGRSIPRGWKTGMPMVDAFLNAHNFTGVPRRALVWSPARHLQYAPSVGPPGS